MLTDAGRRLLFVAGQVGWDEGERIVPGGLVAQFGRALRNVLAVVQAAGGQAEDVVRLTIYVADKNDYARSASEIGAVYREVLGRHYPAMSLVQVAALLEDGAVVEIEATAALQG